ncbi:MAG: hypothetical protein HYX47_11965 [Burkholderiales bacterium]|nr:hypothetical protein [Burkholderiales bacterium]
MTLADGSSKPIDQVTVGDQVRSADGRALNTVKFVERVAATHWGHLYSPDPARFKPFATINHPMVIDGELASPYPQNTALYYPWFKRVRRIDGASFESTTDTTVYNLWVTGDGTYQVNGFGTHSIAGSGGLLRRLHDTGDLSYEDVLRAAQYFATVPRDRRLGAKRVNDWLEGIPLSAAGRKRMARRLMDATNGSAGGMSTRAFRWTCVLVGLCELLADGILCRRRMPDEPLLVSREVVA